MCDIDPSLSRAGIEYRGVIHAVDGAQELKSYHLIKVNHGDVSNVSGLEGRCPAILKGFGVEFRCLVAAVLSADTARLVRWFAQSGLFSGVEHTVADKQSTLARIYAYIDVHNHLHRTLTISI